MSHSLLYSHKWSVKLGWSHNVVSECNGILEGASKHEHFLLQAHHTNWFIKYVLMQSNCGHSYRGIRWFWQFQCIKLLHIISTETSYSVMINACNYVIMCVINIYEI